MLESSSYLDGSVSGTDVSLKEELAFTCQPVSAIKSSDLDSANWQNNCLYYYKLPSNEFGCLRCVDYFTGNLVNFKVDHCRVYETSGECK